MVVDSSAVVLEEPHTVHFLTRLTQATFLNISAVTLTEASIVLLSRGGRVKVDILDALLERLEVEVIPVDRTNVSWHAMPSIDTEKGATKRG